MQLSRKGFVSNDVRAVALVGAQKGAVMTVLTDKGVITLCIAFGSIFLAVGLGIGAGIRMYRATHNLGKAVDRGIFVGLGLCGVIMVCGTVIGFPGHPL